jgi:hypothetical protein
MLVNAGSLKLVNIRSTKMMQRCRTLLYGRGKKKCPVMNTGHSQCFVGSALRL